MNRGEVEARRIFAQALTEARAVAETPQAEDKLLPAGPGYLIVVGRFDVKLLFNVSNPECEDLVEILNVPFRRTVCAEDLSA